MSKSKQMFTNFENCIKAGYYPCLITIYPRYCKEKITINVNTPGVQIPFGTKLCTQFYKLQEVIIEYVNQLLDYDSFSVLLSKFHWVYPA